jgi:6-phosphogluconolactonase
VPKETAARSVVEISPNVIALSVAAAEQVVVAAKHAIDARGNFVLALSGGSTPRRMYELLAREPYASRVNWPRVHVVWSDERCVPPVHADSNYRMARESLLEHVPIRPANVHRMHGEDDPAAAAASYETALRTLFDTPNGPPSSAPGKNIDLALLGLGGNGHTASIFPESAAASEQRRWVMAEHVSEVSMWRITLTAPILNAAAEVLFLVAGGDKADVLRRVLEGPRLPRELPAQLIAPARRQIRWLVDVDAAAELGTKT